MLIAILLIFFLYIMPIVTIVFGSWLYWKKKGHKLQPETLLGFVPILNIIFGFMFLYEILRDDVDWEKVTVKLFGERGDNK